jgi:prephenate dehydrogenase/chorismate mutase
MTLDDFRDRIKATDEQIIDLIEQRVSIAKEIGEVKAREGKPIKNYHVEQQVHERIRGLARNADLLDSTAEQITDALIKEAVRGQEDDRRQSLEAQDGDRYLLVGGEENMGRWFQDYLRQGGASVRTVDEKPTADHQTIPSLQDYDCVLLTTPVHVTPQILSEIRRRDPDVVVADITSVKAPVEDELKQLKDNGVPVTSFHPMFDADSNTLNGKNVIIASLNCSRADKRIRALFQETAAEVTTVPFDDHDRIITTTLALPHIVNLVFGDVLKDDEQSLSELNRLAGTTFQEQAHAAKEVFSENPAVYHAIQHYAGSAYLFTAIRSALQAVETAADQSHPEAMEEIMRETGAYFTADGD